MPHRSFVLLLAMIPFCGCNPRDPKQPATYKVTGKVTYQGNPLEGAEVIFMTEKSPRPGRGTTNKDGEFVLSTYGAGDGAMAGQHRVTVTKWEIPEFAKRNFKDSGEGDRERAKAIAEGLPTDPKLLTPSKYKAPATSGLSFKVEPQGKNHFELPLVDD